MLSVTFKNVGQGDSIIIEWEDKEKTKVGIIDCNLFNHQNPILDHIKASNYQEIDFIILSHPHYDHFSGFNQLLDYCLAHRIIIHKFLHTSQQTPDYLKVANKTFVAQRELATLFKKVRQLWKVDKIILQQGYIDDMTRDLALNTDIYLKILAPTTLEFDSYISNINVTSNEENIHSNANANWLSTFLKIYTSEWQILLTSDVEKKVLNRWKNNPTEFASQQLLLAQSPHHGAKGNHSQVFWKQFMPGNGSKIVISVGENSYQHPSKETLKYFTSNGFKVLTTQEGEILSSSTIHTSQLLDIFSKKRVTIQAKDVCFKISQSGKINLLSQPPKKQS